MDEPARTDMQRGSQEQEGILHVLNGDATAIKLRPCGIPGAVAVWADVLHDGPVLPDLTPAQRREMRARFISSHGMISYEQALALSTSWDETLDTAPTYDEVVLWFEHDLFDQLLLIRQLDWLAMREMRGIRLSLICIGEHPDVADFVGLGQLTPEQLAALYPARAPVTPAQIELARAAWRAFTAPDPTGLEPLAAARDTSPLPFLAGALRRHLQEFPWVRDGLPRTERQILAAVAAGARSPADAFTATQRMEERIYMGDWSFWWRVRELAAGDVPALDLDVGEADGALPRGALRLTESGRAVLEGRADWVELNGIDRWLGGVHLHGDDSAWRWDEDAGRLVPPIAAD